MVITIHLILIICGLLCFLSAAFSWPSGRVNPFYLAWAFLTASLLI